jgi:transcriptional regulator with XRE-family HTH domain
MEWDAVRIRALRLALRLPQEAFAEKLGAVSKTVAYWERGERPPGLRLQRELDELFAKVTDEQKQRFLAAVAESGPTRTEPAPATLARERESEQENATNRRHALKLGAATAGMAVAASIESLELSRGATATNVAPSVLDQLERRVQHLISEHQSVPPAELFIQVQAWRHYVVELGKGHHTTAESRRLNRIAGWLSVLLGDVTHALGENASSELHCDAALSLAEEAGDANLGAWARVTQASIATYAAQPQEATKVARSGRQMAPVGSSAAVMLAAMEARAWARLGDRQAFEIAMVDAERAFEQLSESPNGSVFSVSLPDLWHRASTAYVWLDQPVQARNYAAKAIGLCDADPDNWQFSRVTARIDQGLAFAQDGELEGAILIGMEALDLAQRRPIDPIRRRSAELMRALHPHRDLSTVRDFEERYRAIWDS